MNRLALILMFAILLLMSALAKDFQGTTRCLRPKPTQIIVAAPKKVQQTAPNPPTVNHLPRSIN